MSASASDPGIADEIHRLFVALEVRIKEHEERCLDALDLSRMEAKALYRLEPGETVALRVVAERGGVDPSNLSAPVERLERRGLVERRAAKHDRRVRAVALTASGVRLRDRLVACLVDGYPAVASLDPGEREQLRNLLRSALDL